MSHPIVAKLKSMQEWEGRGPFGLEYRVRGVTRSEAVALRKALPALTPGDAEAEKKAEVETLDQAVSSDPFTRALVCTCVKVNFEGEWVSITEKDDGTGLPYDELQSGVYWLVEKVNSCSGYGSDEEASARRIL